MKHSIPLIAGALALALPSVAPAATVYFGENLDPAGTVSGAPVTARNLFFAQLSGVSTETFEGFANGATPSELSFNGSAGTITANFAPGAGSVLDSGSVCCGRFTTSGTKLYETNSAFSATFSTAISAFGFYATDIGDFAGQLSLTLIRSGGTEEILVPHTISGPNGSLLFFGVIDQANPFTAIRFNTTNGDDFFGFDDMVIGDPGQVTGGIPEPATWAMMIGGFGVVGGAVRRRRRSVTAVFA